MTRPFPEALMSQSVSLLLVSLACVAMSALLAWLLARRLPKEDDGWDKMISYVVLGVLVVCGLIGLGCSGFWLKTMVTE